MSIEGKSIRPEFSPTIAYPKPAVVQGPGVLNLPSGETRSVAPGLPEEGSPIIPPGPKASPGPSSSPAKEGSVPSPRPLSSLSQEVEILSSFSEELHETAQKATAIRQRVLEDPSLKRVSSAPNILPQHVEETEKVEVPLSRSLLEEIGIPGEDAQKIFDGWSVGWKGLVKKTDEGWQQTHDIKGLKVYEDPKTGHLVAAYGLQQLGAGASKRAKEFMLILDDGTVEFSVRYARKKKQDLMGSFLNEFSARYAEEKEEGFSKKEQQLLELFSHELLGPAARELWEPSEDKQDRMELFLKTFLARYEGEKGEGLSKKEQELLELFSREFLEADAMENAEVFSKDIGWELEKRGQLAEEGKRGSVPNLLEIQAVSYINKRGEKKIRYVAQKCVGNAQGLMYDKNLELLPPEKRRQKVALLCCKEGLVALDEMHKRYMVHKDIKLANILVVKVKGETPVAVLGDLGFAARLPHEGKEGDPYIPRGSAGYSAPEILLEEATSNSPAMDMYSVGIVLLEVVHPEDAEYVKFAQANLKKEVLRVTAEGRSVDAAKADDEELKKALEFYEAVVLVTQNKLRESGDGLEGLIASLLERDPKERPTSAQTLQTVTSYVQLGLFPAAWTKD